MLQARIVMEPAARAPGMTSVSPPIAQALFMVAVAAGVAAGLSLTGQAATARAIAAAGPDLTQLLRFMVALKLLLVAGAAAAILWRLSSGISAGRLAVYAGLSSVMAAGLGEMWAMAHLVLGAVMLHGGLVAAVVLLWHDPALHQRLEMALSRRSLRGLAKAGVNARPRPSSGSF